MKHSSSSLSPKKLAPIEQTHSEGALFYLTKSLKNI